MKKVAIVTLSVLLSACSSGDYVTNVTSESHREEFKMDTIPEPLMAQQDVVQETNLPQPMVKVETPVEEKAVVKLSPQTERPKAVKIVPPSQKQRDQLQRFGYTIQVMAVGTQSKVDYFASRLPKNEQPIWKTTRSSMGLNGLLFCTAISPPVLRLKKPLPIFLKSLKT